MHDLLLDRFLSSGRSGSRPRPEPHTLRSPTSTPLSPHLSSRSPSSSLLLPQVSNRCRVVEGRGFCSIDGALGCDFLLMTANRRHWWWRHCMVLPTLGTTRTLEVAVGNTTTTLTLRLGYTGHAQ
ncbi:uncharacterized protein LOC116253841 isoform X2 [Nymphaea colorata]|uniref:uncharacterized protein LOC116253841 isoform X2 n=1 Tax=Nymphaea colorata TaxID=210225 RepID=UPI00214E595A|nr:uncharacterized protein LOC116253841 isoform X2 [Nymphaea colorata]